MLINVQSKFGLLKLIAEDFIQVDKIETVLPFYRELVEKTRQEKGCIAYELHQDIKSLGHFIFVEVWVDRAALDLHVKSEHFQRLVPQIDQHKVKEGRFTHMNKLDFQFSKTSSFKPPSGGFYLNLNKCLIFN